MPLEFITSFLLFASSLGGEEAETVPGALCPADASF